ncbi:MAG: FRG domain-containing protein [Planctomycetota bacterium]
MRPKIGRVIIDVGYTLVQRELGSLQEFIRMASPHLTTVPENEWDQIAIAQHYGLSTRLLDWTENPLIAAYFASNENRETDSVIYVLDRLKHPPYSDYKDDSDPGFPSPFTITENMIFRPKHITTRIVAQSGVFTVHNNPKEPFESKSLQKWVLKSECLNQLYHILSLYGVNEATVFPSLVGVAKYIERFGWYSRPYDHEH